MTKEQLEAIFDRVRAWPAEWQDEAVAVLLTIEAGDGDDDDGPIELTEEELADLEEGLAEAERGEFVSDEEVKAMFDRFRK